VHSLYLAYLSNLYIFRATVCPSSGETAVFMRYLVLVILCGWLSGMQGGWLSGMQGGWLSGMQGGWLSGMQGGMWKCRIKKVVSP